MSGELDPNAALFGGDEQEDPEKEHLEMTFGRNPNRTSAMADLFLKDMIATVENDPEPTASSTSSWSPWTPTPARMWPHPSTGTWASAW